MSEAEIQSCEDALRHLAAHIDHELDTRTERQVKRHLEICRSCYSRVEFEKRLKARLGALSREPVRPQLSNRIRTLVRTFTAEGGR